MRIPFNNFEEIFGEIILDRGLSYYKDGHVTEVVKISDNEFEITVVGTEEYSVALKIEKDKVVEYFCNCPYDRGPVCKHIIASLYYLKENEVYFGNTIQLPKEKFESKTVTQQLNEVLERVSDRELKEFIVDRGKADKQFRNLFLSTFSYPADNISKEFYQKQINAIVHASTDKYGLIGWNEMDRFQDAMSPIFSNMKKQYEEQNYQTAFHIAAALMEEMVDGLQFIDDSMGSIGCIIKDALEMLHNIALKHLPEDFREEFYNYCITAFKEEFLEAGDWHIDILTVAFRLIENEHEADRVIECLDNVKEKYLMDEVQSFKMKILTKYKDKAEAQRFIDENITNSLMRNAEIQNAFINKDFERAIKLSKEGIEHDKEKRPELQKDGYSWL